MDDNGIEITVQPLALSTAVRHKARKERTRPDAISPALATVSRGPINSIAIAYSGRATAMTRPSGVIKGAATRTISLTPSPPPPYLVSSNLSIALARSESIAALKGVSSVAARAIAVAIE